MKLKIKWLAWAAFGAMAVYSVSYGLHEVDFWWHLAVGRRLIEARDFLSHDLFSHTMNGAPWFNYEWLFDGLLYLCWKIGGFGAVYFLKVLLCLAAAGLLVATLRVMGASGLALWALSTWAFLVIHYRLLEKPELVTLLFLPVLLFGLARVDEWPDRFKKIFLWVYFGMMVIWVNTHPGFIYALIMSGCAVIGARLGGYKKDALRFIDRILVVGLAAFPFNPDGFGLIHVFVDHAAGSPVEVSSDYIPTVFDWAHAPFWSMFFLSLVSGVAALVSPKLKRLRIWAPAALFFAWWGTRYMRNMVLLPYAALPLLAALFIPWWEKRRAQPSWMAGGVLVCGVLAVQWFSYTAYILKILPAPPVSTAVPAAACEYLEKNNIGGRIFNEVDFGGYLDWRWDGERKIFMDGRNVFANLMLETNQVWTKNLSYREFFDKYGVDHALVSYQPRGIKRVENGGPPFPLNIRNLMFPKKDWALVFWDDHALVFLRRIPKFEPLVRQDEYKAVWPYNLAQTTYLLENNLIRSEDARRELDRHLQQAGPTVLNQKLVLLVPQRFDRREQRGFAGGPKAE